ncbi:hypothetical protein LDL08_22540 [Nonomuraea glycinis]|uniref:Secreted protein n=1 Tax=Nonomuraea glycinis TaxID=2047744 RepID=A0A918E591_9ACTN|nr:hypothetical protein [Nonomuraea glycinis]MCA2178972.1 hypothetical protein [Nonomuraea glycinis]GGP08417.1 hypothetical protein GCM10012278_40050 [Nonomuraea glycinis]
MNPWHEVLDRIEARDDEDLTTFLDGLSDLGRKAVAVQLPAHLAEELRGGFEARWEIETQLASGYRLTGAACLSGAEQVATWLNRRELREPRAPEQDAARIVSLLRHRPLEWRRDLAVRLADRLRPPTGRASRRSDGMPGWELAAALVAETGVEPPDGDAFVAGWVWRQVWRRRVHGNLLDGDPLLDALLPRLFEVPGVAAPLVMELRWDLGRSTIGELAELADKGRIPRATLIAGCARRFMTGGSDMEISPFVGLWRLLRPEPADIPVLDFVRLLPSAAPPLAQLAVDELQRAEAADLLDDELFAEALGSLVYRREKGLLRAAVQWLARTPASRGGGAVPALAVVFDVDTPALRERAVRLAVKLVPYVDAPGRESIREAATRLPSALRERVAAAYGPVDETEPERPAAAVLRMPALPGLAPPFTSPAEVVTELRALSWMDEPLRCERVLAGLVELTHGDRDAMTAALWQWWEETRSLPCDPDSQVFDRNAYHRDTRTLLARCALAIVAPEQSRRVSTSSAGTRTYRGSEDWPPQRLLRHRLEEVIALFERGETIPALLATPTAPTGHVEAATLVERMERLAGTEPLPADFKQALLRLPRNTDPDLLVRAEKLPSQAGRTLAAWLRDGAWPDPDVDWAVQNEQAYYLSDRRLLPKVVPPEGLPDWLEELWVFDSPYVYLSYRHDVVWWPVMMPSYREIVAAWLIRSGPDLSSSNDPRMETLAALAHGDGPVGAATAAVLVSGLGHRRDEPRAAAADAALTLAARGRFPAAACGAALIELIRLEFVVLKRSAAALGDLTDAGAHAEVWRLLTAALPRLIPSDGERPRAGLGDLLGVAARAATLAGARGEIDGLAALAARKGPSLVLHEARHLYEVLSG